MGPRKRRGTLAQSNAYMTVLARAFTPTSNRRLNELIGFVVLIFALLLILALVSYSPLDPSLNTAAAPPAGRPSHNWIGPFGAVTSDLTLQVFGVSAFLIPIFLAMYSLRWFRSRPILSPIAKSLGAAGLLLFAAGFLGLLPWGYRWMGAIPIEGLLGRILADALIHYFNVVGAYLICLTMIAVALYLATAFSFGAMHIWSQTRFSFVYAALDRFSDWRAERERKKAAKELEKKRSAANAKPVVTAQLVPRRADAAEQAPVAENSPRVPVAKDSARGSVKSGIERMFDAELGQHSPTTALRPLPSEEPTPATTDSAPQELPASGPIAVTSRADNSNHGKTTMPKLAGGFKLPSTALLKGPTNTASSTRKS